MAARRTPHEFALGLEQAEAVAAEVPRARAVLAAGMTRRLRVALPAINVLEAAVTYVFVTYVVPLPGNGLPASARTIGLVSTLALVMVGWFVCDWWGGRALRPITSWLEQNRPPTPAERLRALRLPLLEAGQVLAVWVGAGIGSLVIDLALGEINSTNQDLAPIRLDQAEKHGGNRALPGPTFADERHGLCRGEL